MNKTKKKQTHRYREQTSGYQWGDEQGMANRGRERKVRVIMELYEITCVKFLKKKNDIWDTYHGPGKDATKYCYLGKH